MENGTAFPRVNLETTNREWNSISKGGLGNQKHYQKRANIMVRLEGERAIATAISCGKGVMIRLVTGSVTASEPHNNGRARSNTQQSQVNRRA